MINESLQHSLVVGDYDFTWLPASKLWRISAVRHQRTGYSAMYSQEICQVLPYKDEYHTEFYNAKKMYTVKASSYPGIGELEQMVRGSDLQAYIDSIRMGRGM